jgi:copper chaperone CopZ
LVTGMTCGHCVKAVTEELQGLDGVTEVSVELAPDAVSTVTVTADGPLDLAAVKAAVEEAGYELAS